MERFILTAEVTGSRLDSFISERHPELSRSQVQRLIREGLVMVRGRSARPGLRLKGGDIVEVTLPPPTPSPLEPEAIPLNIIYEDSDLLVVDKPPGLPVHPSPGHPRHTLVQALLAHCPDLQGVGGVERPGIVHRLDKDTSGLMVVAKNDAAHRGLSRQFKARTLEKGYLVLLTGSLFPREGVIDAPIGRDPSHRQRMAVVEEGRPARTRYRVVQQLEGFSLVEAMPETGRTHQVRVHFASLGHPVAGDPTYGRRHPYLERQFLHAYRLAFTHPRSGQRLEFRSELPPDLRRAWGYFSPGLSPGV